MWKILYTVVGLWYWLLEKVAAGERDRCFLSSHLIKLVVRSVHLISEEISGSSDMASYDVIKCVEVINTYL